MDIFQKGAIIKVKKHSVIGRDDPFISKLFYLFYTIKATYASMLVPVSVTSLSIYLSASNIWQ